MEFSDIKVNVLGFTSEHNKYAPSFAVTLSGVIRPFKAI